MAIEKKTLPYEILLRFNFDPNVGPLGEFRGAHYIEADALLDSETGEVVSYKPGPAKEMSSEMASKYFGDAFAQFESGYRTVLGHLISAAEDVESHKRHLTEQSDVIDALTIENEALIAEKMGKPAAAIPQTAARRSGFPASAHSPSPGPLPTEPGATSAH